MSKTLNAIESANMIFISAQPDEPYFHCQVELYMHNFSKFGIENRSYAIFGYKDTPSKKIIELSSRYNIYYYKDTREINTENNSINSHILKKFFYEHPNLGQCIFYHKSDILLTRLPKFELLLNDTNSYLSITSDISYTDLCEASERYKSIYQDLPTNDILKILCDVINISEDLVKMNDTNSGTHYILKDVDTHFWNSVENNIYNINKKINEYNINHVIENPVNINISDKISILWEYWKLGKETQLHSELNFSLGKYTTDMYNSVPIFYTTDNNPIQLYDTHSKNSNIFEDYRINRSIFNNIHENSALNNYVKLIKDYTDSDSYISTKSFLLLTKDKIGGLYKEDPTIIHNNKAVWRSTTGNFIIFFNSSKWILVNMMAKISDTLKGIAYNSAVHPYINEWSIPCQIMKS